MTEEKKQSHQDGANKGKGEHKGTKAPVKDAPKEAAKEEGKGKKVLKKKTKRRNVQVGNAYVQASYNNTIVTITEQNGSVLSWSSAGSSGFKGARKSTPYAAQISAEKAAEKAKVYGLERVHVYIKGVGAGREQSVRGLVSSGLDIISLNDVTPIPHNGCRKKKARRV